MPPRRIGLILRPPPTEGERHDVIGNVTGLRRHRRRSTLRRLTDRDAAGPQGLPGAGGRSGVVPERHRLDARDPRAGRRRAAPLGAARPGDGHRLPADRDLLVRLRAVHDHRARRDPTTASRRRTRRGAPCSTRSSSTPPPTRAPRCASASPSRTSSSRTARSSASAATAKAARPCVERARVVIGADGRNSHVAKAVRPAPVQRQADAPVELLHVLERPARRRLRDRHPSRSRLRRGRRRTTD